MTKKLLIAAFAVAGLAGSIVAAQAKTNEHLMHYVSTMQSGTYGAIGPSTMRSNSYGTSKTSVGTVTAPSVGSYNWPSVGVTNAVPTWNNSNPAVHR